MDGETSKEVDLRKRKIDILTSLNDLGMHIYTYISIID